MIAKTSSILITGGNGFLGRVVARKLREAGYVDVRTFGSSEFDLTKQADAEKLFFYHNPEAVIHLAAKVGGIGANQENPGKFAYDNLVMGANVIEMCRKYQAQKLIIAGTICCYPRITPVPFKEENLYDGYPEPTNAPYGMAKKMLLVLSQGYRKQYGSNFVYLLPVNLYGPCDSFDLKSNHVVPAMIKKFHDAKTSNSKQVILWGDGSPTREFLYVDDCAEAFVAALEKYDGGDPINIGSGQEIYISDLAYKIAAVVGYDGEIRWDNTRPNGQMRRCLDTSRAEKLLGWKARTNLDAGLKQTYNWYVNQGGVKC
jgi:GDP-L-fucose synthase